ncbi:MAG: hypothetical protein ACTSQ4_02280 [Candidatus Heimdallarchaeaceae archaeon]
MIDTPLDQPLIEPSSTLQGLAYCVWKMVADKSQKGEYTSFSDKEEDFRCFICNGYQMGCKDYVRQIVFNHETDPDGRRRVL